MLVKEMIAKLQEYDGKMEILFANFPSMESEFEPNRIGSVGLRSIHRKYDEYCEMYKEEDIDSSEKDLTDVVILFPYETEEENKATLKKFKKQIGEINVSDRGKN
jgi:hypothetical protein